MPTLPFRFSPLGQRMLVTSEAGDFFFTTENMLERMVLGQLEEAEQSLLRRRGFAFREVGDFHFKSAARRLAERKRIDAGLQYLLLVPTLRCDLACSYCQVSRAAETAKGYDWDEERLAQVRTFIKELPDPPGGTMKIEFQGGEPSLRCDLMEAVIDSAESRFKHAEFVICTNLMRLSEPLLALLERPNVAVSTSIDGPAALQTANRTASAQVTQRFFANLAQVMERFGPEKVSALATIPRAAYERIPEVIEVFAELGLTTLFLRPVNYQGFARKRHAGSRDEVSEWQTAYRSGLDYIFQRNMTNEIKLREYGLEVALKRIFLRGSNGHVDLRSPNPVGQDYLVVDYDGRFYPSDEARMLARVGYEGLSIGDISSGVDRAAAARFNWNQMNEVHEDCIHCAFQPYCGIDLIDELSRYGRTDMPKHDTAFCRMNTFVFRMIFEMLQSSDPVAIANLSGHLNGSFEATPFFAPLVYDPVAAATARPDCGAA